MATKLFTLAATWLSIFCIFQVSQFMPTNAHILQEFTGVQLTSRLENPSLQEWPLCVIYKSSSEVTQLEKILLEFLNGLEEENYYEKWNFATINTQQHIIPLSASPSIIPSLLCYIGESSPLQYGEHKPLLKSVKKWLKNVAKSYKNEISPVNLNALKTLVATHDGITLVGVPGNLFHMQLEESFKEVAVEWKNEVKFYMIPPMTDDERHVCEKYGILEFPAVLVFDKQEWDDNQKPVTLLQGQLNTGVYQIKLELTIRNTTASILTLANFKSEVLETNIPTSPIAVTFYSHRNPRSLDYTYVLDKTIKEFGKIDSSFQFGFVNLVDSSEVVFRHVNVSLVSGVPFTIIFWQSKHQDDYKYIIKQTLFNQGIPTTHNLYSFVQSNNIPLLIDTDMNTDWLVNQKLEVCDVSENQENECAQRDNTTVVMTSHDGLLVEEMARAYGPEPAPAEWKAIKMAGSANVSTDIKIPVVTDQTWAAKIEQSVRPTKTYGPKGNQDSTSQYLVSLVVFIKGQCGYCTKIMPVLRDIANSVKMISASMYLMNCTTDPVHCDRFGITGYPTLTSFRSLSWSVVEHCYPSSQKSHYIRVDYHGAIVPSRVLDWLSNLIQPAVDVQYMHDHLPEDLNQDVYLVATVYTRSLARQYLTSRLIDRWYTYQCYTLVCELLYGLVPCYALYTRDVVDHVAGTRNEKDLIVSKLILQRNDGVRATIFELGYNLAFTLNQESDSRLHMFHKPHRYNVDGNFRCEDDHRMCTEYAVQFVQDHRRLPVTQITTAIFHTKTRSQDRTSDVFTHDLPVMLILARTQNISRDSHFYKELTVAAYSLYQDMVFTTLNVDEFSFWASNFVPKGYLTKFAHDLSGTAPSLYHYPRLCIVRWEDHKHAAFYPPVSEMERLGTRVQKRLDAIDSQQIIKFARNFSEHPEKMLIRTEMF